MKNFINDRLINALESHPDRVAFATAEVSFSYAKLAHLVPRIATKLQAEGINRGSQIGISHSSGIDYLLSWSLLWLGISSCSRPEDLPLVGADLGLDWLALSAPTSESEGVLGHGIEPSNLVIDRLWLMEAEAISEPIAALDLDEASIARLSIAPGSTGESECVSLSFGDFTQFSQDNSPPLTRGFVSSPLNLSSPEGFEVIAESFELGASLYHLDLDADPSMLRVPDLALEQIIGTAEQLRFFLGRLGQAADRLWSLKTVRVLGTGVSAEQQEQLKEGFGCDLEVNYRSAFKWVSLND